MQEVNFEEQSYTALDTSRSLVVANVSKDYTELDEQIMSMMLKREEIWSCKVCGKTDDKLNKKQNIQQHVESVHMEGGSHSCNRCGKTLRSRPSLRMHISRNH